MLHRLYLHVVRVGVELRNGQHQHTVAVQLQTDQNYLRASRVSSTCTSALVESRGRFGGEVAERIRVPGKESSRPIGSYCASLSSSPRGAPVFRTPDRSVQTSALLNKCFTRGYLYGQEWQRQGNAQNCEEYLSNSLTAQASRLNGWTRQIPNWFTIMATCDGRRSPRI